MENSTEGFSVGYALLAYCFTGLCVIIAAFVTSRAITKLDKVSHKKELLSAFEAEIFEYLKHANDFDPMGLLHDFSGKLNDFEGYFILLPSESNNLVYKSLGQSIHALPQDLVSSVVKFYNAMHSVESVVKTINNPDYKNMGVTEKMIIYHDYINLKIVALKLAHDALEDIREAKKSYMLNFLQRLICRFKMV